MLRSSVGFNRVSLLVGREASGEGEECMATSGLIRWGAIGLILGGVMWLLLGLSALFGYL